VLKAARRAARRALNRAGWELVRCDQWPAHNRLGLGALHVRTILDVGANEGQFAAGALARYPEAHVFSFEPVPEVFPILAAWAATTGRVTPMNLALGDSEGEVEMFQHTAHSPSSSLLPTTKVTEGLWPFTAPQKTVRVQLTTLDKALEGRLLPQDLLVKLDVQGYEDRVIRGGRETLSRAKACIVEVDLDALYHGQASFKDLVVSLDALGLRYGGALEQVFAADGHVVYFDAVFLRAER
jgi:FkbM family methyltransferase